MARIAYIVLSFMTALIGAASVQAATVGVAGSTTTVRPTDAAPAASTIHLSAAQNEFESFQIVVAAGSQQLDGLNVTVAGQLSDGAGHTIPLPAITIYREAYLNIATESDGELGSAKGRFPDALIPARDPWYGEARNAFPVVVPIGENRVAWIDVQIPNGQTPGEYSGSLRVTGNGLDITVPFDVAVAGVALPSTSSLRGAFDINVNLLCQVHDCNAIAGGGWALDALYARVALDNRLTLAKPSYGTPTAPVINNFRTYVQPLFNGTAPTRLEGAQLTDTVIYQWCSTCTGAWKTEGERDGFADRIIFHCDEIGRNVTLWQTCKDNYNTASSVWNSTGSNVGALPLDATITANELDWAKSYTASDSSHPFTGLANSLSTIVVLVNRLNDKVAEYQGDQTSRYTGFRSNPRNRVWGYQSCTSHGCVDDEYRLHSYWNGWPSYAVDQPASEARAMPWILFNNNAGGEYYFETLKKFNTAWTDQYNEGGNGDGTLFYPGTARARGNSPSIGGTHDIPIESIRLKRIRDGREDYEYLNFLSENGQRSQALTTARGLFPNPYSTNVSQSRIDSTRSALLALMAGVAASTPTQPTAPSPTPPPTGDWADSPETGEAVPTYYCFGAVATIVGTEGADKLVGTPGDDVITGLGGSDIIIGNGGNDIICAGMGADVVNGGNGSDRVGGGPGSDRIIGGRGSDRLEGGAKKDALFGGNGADLIIGGTAGDRMLGGSGNDDLRKDNRADIADGGSGTDVIRSVDGSKRRG